MNKGAKFTEEHKRHLSAALKGKNNKRYCRRGHDTSICGRTPSRACRKCCALTMQVRRKANPIRDRKNNKTHYDKLKAQAFARLGNKCNNPYCLVSGGCADTRCLQIDHVYDDGATERLAMGGRKSGSTKKIYSLVLSDEEGRYQLLCANCNWIKEQDRRQK